MIYFEDFDFVGGQFDNKHLLENELSWRSGQPQKILVLVFLSFGIAFISFS